MGASSGAEYRRNAKLIQRRLPIVDADIELFPAELRADHLQTMADQIALIHEYDRDRCNRSENNRGQDGETREPARIGFPLNPEAEDRESQERKCAAEVSTPAAGDRDAHITQKSQVSCQRASPGLPSAPARGARK